MLVVFIINAVFLSLANFYYSYKIVGPIFRLNNYFENWLKREEIKPLTFRKTDKYEYHHLAAKINKALEISRENLNKKNK